MGRFFKRAKAGGDTAEGLRPRMTPLSCAAIGRLPSRMPVIIRSHEGSGENVTRLLGVGDKIGGLFLRKMIRD